MTQTLYLTLNGGFSDGEVSAVCADKDLGTLRCVLKGYRFEEGDAAILRAKKPDGTACYLAGTCEGGNAFRFPFTEQLTAVEGDVRCDVCLTRGSGSISSDEFILKIRPPSAAGEMVESESEYEGFAALINNAVQAKEITVDEINLLWEEEQA